MPPQRMSAPKAEDTKPSNFIAAFWWIVFIIPVIFTWVATQSILYVGILVGIRVVIMFVPKSWFSKPKPVVVQEEKKTIPSRSFIKPIPKTPEPVVVEKVIAKPNPLTPYKDELISEWKGLLKMLRIYDHDKESMYLAEYRKLRGWDK